MADQVEILSFLKQLGVVRHETITAKEGGVSALYVEIKQLFGEPKNLHTLALALSQLIDSEATCIAAVGYGGIPLATAISSIRNLRLVLVRAQPKAHGKGGLLEGYIPRSSDRVAIVDDKIITGDTINHVINVIGRIGAQVSGVYVVVDTRDSQSSPQVSSLVTLNELMS